SNEIRAVSFQLADVRKWKSAQAADVITANLYSDLLVKILSKLSARGWLILSGILRSQKDELIRALRRNHFDIIGVNRRGKWLVYRAGGPAANFCGGNRPPLQQKPTPSVARAYCILHHHS